jgi:hypothetical protein
MKKTLCLRYLILGFLTVLPGIEMGIRTAQAEASDGRPVLAPEANSDAANQSAFMGPMNAEFGLLQRLSLSYLAIFYGPSLQNPHRLQPKLSGEPDPDRPVNLRNFLNLGYAINQTLSLTGTAYWSYQPYLEQKLTLQDPFIRLSDTSLFQMGNFNLYADLRVHFGTSASSRQNDQYFGVQTVEVATYVLPDSPLTLALYGALRGNVFGKHGNGYDLEMYLGPNINYQITPKLLATVLYEMRASHIYGAKVGVLNNDGTDLQPGVTWEMTPKFMINPYLNLLTGGKINLKTTTIGLMANWNLL